MASIGSEHAPRWRWRASSWRAALGGSLARVHALFADGSESSLARRLAGAAFLIRVVSAAIAFVSQILLARWMGVFEFGVYVYTWTWVLLIGGMVDLGLGSAAQRFIPEYIEHGKFALLRGYLGGSRWLAAGIATGIALLGAAAVFLLSPHLGRETIIPLYLPARRCRFAAWLRSKAASRALTTGSISGWRRSTSSASSRCSH